ncbi:MAG: SurA N-terminal domain-containing protein [Deltaproteobacteria bacterium]|jgi:peptidyl-prolyl cis-trans isomerase SurA|nr:SurA N-terminal domain-containing protein [Deltaproteobacteria bacterium]
MPALHADRRGPRAASLLLAALLLAAWPAASPAATTVDRIVAQVNRNVITLSELQQRVNTLSPPQKAALSGNGDIQRQVLDLMVDEELVSQAALKIGIQVAESEVDEAVKSVMDQNKMDAATFKRALASVGTSLPAFRGQLRLEILKNKVLSYSIMSRIVVTEEEVTDFLNGNVPEGAAQPVFSSTGVSDFDGVRIIFLPSSPGQARSVMATASRIKAEIEAGLPFAEAAKKYSKGPGAEQGGDPGNLVVRDLQPELQTLARQLQPGKVSDPLNGGDAVLLITVLAGTPQAPKETGRKGAKADGASFTSEQRAGARRTLEEMKMRRRYESWIADLRSAAVIKVTL